MHGVGPAAISAILNHKMNQYAVNVKGGKQTPETTPDSGATSKAGPEFTTMVSGEIVMRENHFPEPELTIEPSPTGESAPGVEADFTKSLQGQIHLDEDHFGMEKSILRDEGKAKAYFQRLVLLQKLIAIGLISNDGIKKLTADQVAVLKLDVVQERLLKNPSELDDVLKYTPNQNRNLIIEETRDLISTGKASYDAVLNLSFDQHNRLSFPHVRQEIDRPDGTGLTFNEAANLTRSQDRNLQYSGIQYARDNGWISAKDAINLTENQSLAIRELVSDVNKLQTVTETDRTQTGLAIAEIVAHPEEYADSPTAPAAPTEPTNNKPDAEYMDTNVAGIVHYENLLTAG